MADISVLVPVRSPAPYLATALLSVLNQSQADLELIVVDDGLDERDRDVLHHFEDDSRLRLVPSFGPGLVSALNTGISIANTHLIARMDADDVSLPDRLSVQMQYLREHPGVVVVGGQVELVDGSGHHIGRRHYPVESSKVRVRLRLRNALAHPAVMMRTAAVRAVGGYDPRFPGAEDYDLWLRLQHYGDIANVPETVLQYRVHNDQVTQSQVALVAESTCLAQLRERRSKRGGPELAWAAGTNETPHNLSDRFLRTRVRLAAHCFNRGRQAIAGHQWFGSLWMFVWVALRPCYAASVLSDLQLWTTSTWRRVT